MTWLFCIQYHPAGSWNPPTRHSLKAPTLASSAKPTVSPSPRSRGRKPLVNNRSSIIHPSIAFPLYSYFTRRGYAGRLHRLEIEQPGY